METCSPLKSLYNKLILFIHLQSSLNELVPIMKKKPKKL